MDLGCIDLGCIEKQSNEPFLDSETNTNESAKSNSKSGKKQNKGLKEAGQSNMSALNKFTSQSKKNPLRKSSPLNWFPRKKVDSYLKRKIKQLQEVGGMNSTLDETLGDSNPHYSRVLREKIAVREAAHNAMEARKAAMVEASWCQILQAARIQSKEAETLLLEAEKTAAEAFEVATTLGVIVNDMPDCPQKHYDIETSSVHEGRSTTHTVTASFETAFEVDKQVAAAVKSAFVKLASCPSINKDEFKELLRKVSQNPDTGEELSDFSSEYESDTGSEFESGTHKHGFSSQDLNYDCENAVLAVRQKTSKSKLVDMMLERLRCLQEDELASLAAIVATCGLNAALAEAGNSKQLDLGGSSPDARTLNFPRRISSFGVGKRKQVEAELPSLENFLVKKLTRLEKEVQEAKSARMNEAKEGSEERNLSEETNRNCQNPYEPRGMKLERSRTHNGMARHVKQDVTELPSLDKFLVKHVSKLEREVQEAKYRRNLEPTEGRRVTDLKKDSTTPSAESATPSCSDSEQMGKENIDLNQKRDRELEMEKKESSPTLKQEKTTDCLEIISLQDGMNETKEMENSLEKEKMQAFPLVSENRIPLSQKKFGGTSDGDCQSLDKVLVKHVSRLEKEKMAVGIKEEVVKVKRRDANALLETSEGSLDQILVKHKSRLEKEKIAASQQPDDDQIKHFVSRKEARERELQEAWGGLSLGSMRPHLSRLQRDKAAWLKAEEEERRKAVEEM